MPDRVLLLGYFGQNNLGDDVHTGMAIDAIIARFGADGEVVVLNQGRGTSKRWDGSYIESIRVMHPRSQSLELREGWFDCIRDGRFDFVLTCNSGFANGFSLDVVARAIDRGIPTGHLCIKEPNAGGIVGRTAADVFEASEFANFRFRADRASYSLTNPSAIAGVDPGLLLDLSGRRTTDTVVLAPRWSGIASYDSGQYRVMRKIVHSSPDLRFAILFSSYQDASFEPHIADLPRCRMLDPHRADGSVGAVIEEMASATIVASLGRLHPMIFAAAAGVRTVYVECDAQTADSPQRPMRKVDLTCSEFGVPRVDGMVDQDPLSRAVRVPSERFADRVSATRRLIGIEGRRLG